MLKKLVLIATLALAGAAFAADPAADGTKSLRVKQLMGGSSTAQIPADGVLDPSYGTLIRNALRDRVDRGLKNPLLVLCAAPDATAKQVNIKSATRNPTTNQIEVLFTTDPGASANQGKAYGIADIEVDTTAPGIGGAGTAGTPAPGTAATPTPAPAQPSVVCKQSPTK